VCCCSGIPCTACDCFCHNNSEIPVEHLFSPDRGFCCSVLFSRRMLRSHDQHCPSSSNNDNNDIQNKSKNEVVDCKDRLQMTARTSSERLLSQAHHEVLWQWLFVSRPLGSRTRLLCVQGDHSWSICFLLLLSLPASLSHSCERALEDDFRCQQKRQLCSLQSPATCHVCVSIPSWNRAPFGPV